MILKIFIYFVEHIGNLLTPKFYFQFVTQWSYLVVDHFRNSGYFPIC